MRASRLLAILMLLQVRGCMSASALAAEFEVSVRTIHRDIDQLSAAGVPVYAERGRDGGFRLHDDYQTKLTGFSVEEAQYLFLAGLGAAAADLGVAPALAAAELKLAASLPAEQGARAKHFAERFLFDPTDWYRSRERPTFLAMTAQALWQSRRLRMTYESWDKQVERVVDPLGIVLKSGTWYLVAASRGVARTYRVSNIKWAVVENAPCVSPKRFRLDTYWHKSITEFEASLLQDSANIRLSARGIRRLSDISAAAATALRDAKPLENGFVEATVPIESIEHAAKQFLSLGKDVEVLAPNLLRDRLADEGARLVALYGPQRTDT
jgi:predicted DNA-binding transcriptional regulator YafY